MIMLFLKRHLNRSSMSKKICSDCADVYGEYVFGFWCDYFLCFVCLGTLITCSESPALIEFVLSMLTGIRQYKFPTHGESHSPDKVQFKMGIHTYY